MRTILFVGIAALAQAQSSTPASVQTKVNPDDGLSYAWVPAGTFSMGCSAGDQTCDSDEKPAHRVTLTKGYWMGQTEVTVAAYRKFAGATNRSMPEKPSSFFQGEQHPVVNVDWNDAVAYCRWAGGRLPTEAEWEYAARGGTEGARYGVLDEIAWYDSNSGGGTHTVGKMTPNIFGLYDMLGNVWEWCSDWYGAYRNSPATDPKGPSTGDKRLLRGGGGYDLLRLTRASNRNGDQPEGRGDDNGFRCVREVIP